jgi:putative holliday junction resolvase
MRCLGIDYGEKRIGLAFGDDLGIATPLPALTDPRFEQRMEGLAAAVRDRRIDRLVLGLPYNMDGTIGFKGQEVEAFAAKLRDRFGLPIHFVDETLTSHEASQRFGRKRDDELRRSGKIDSVAACLILQDYLDSAPRDLPPAAGPDESHEG